MKLYIKRTVDMHVALVFWMHIYVAGQFVP